MSKILSVLLLDLAKPRNQNDLCAELRYKTYFVSDHSCNIENPGFEVETSLDDTPNKLAC